MFNPFCLLKRWYEKRQLKMLREEIESLERFRLGCEGSIEAADKEIRIIEKQIRQLTCVHDYGNNSLCTNCGKCEYVDVIR